ncbi:MULTISPECIES: hypothetical protein [unclassified Vibrio]|uniref:hypothetical protein n=1 Tax=unclassified Vibrio TaxID=2614977 RepID=UPI000B8FDA1E|nr:MULTISPECIES: hypothetical protein [unclassified Vibrio]
MKTKQITSCFHIKLCCHTEFCVIDLDKESVLAKISVLTVSLANAKAAANEKNIPLYAHIASL